jgi:hypothetical protein
MKFLKETGAILMQLWTKMVNGKISKLLSFDTTTVKFENFFIFSDLRCKFRNMKFLLELLLSFPLSSAVCERGFSAMKWIASDWR